MNLSGRTISHYAIHERLGSGGMGEVYRATDFRLDRQVALKFLSPELTSDQGARERFVQEARTASSLQHPSICTIHDIEESGDGQTFICMDFYEGSTLQDRLKKGPLSPAEAVSIGVQVARGLATAHEHGIIHRDIKPGNIIVTTDGTAKILDFGLAKLARHSLLTKPGTTVGTIAYMSPEQARGAEVDQATDLWSLGVVLYEALTGVRPFWSEYEQATIYSILNEEPVAPGKLNPSIPSPLEGIIRHALAKDPAARYRSAGEFASDLETLREPATPRPTAAPGTLRTMMRKSRAIALGSLLLVLVVTALLLLVPSSAVPFTERGWIVIADFENTTGEEIFDKALNTAFDVSIEQSNYVNVVPRHRLTDVLRRMKMNQDTVIAEPVAREIAVREGLNLVVCPAISRIGTTYALTWKIEEAKNGTTLKSGVINAGSADHILPALDDMCDDIRRSLGESRISLYQRGKELTVVTTRSLGALKEYSLGIESHWKMNFEDARLHYRAALQIDSTFTAARASLGMICFERFDTAEGRVLLARALTGLDGVTDKERYGILAFHARAVENNTGKSEQFWRTLLDLYPDYGPAHNNLGFLYFQSGDYEGAAAEYREAIRCDPTLYLTYYGLEWVYLYNLCNVDSALAVCRRHLAVDSSQSMVYDNIGWAYAGMDSMERASAAFERLAAANPKYVVGLFRLSDSRRMLGRYERAVPPLEHILQMDRNESWANYELGLLHRLMGNAEKAKSFFRLYLTQLQESQIQHPEDGKNLIEIGKVTIRLGDSTKGMELGYEGIRLDTAAHFELAQLLAAAGRPEDALHQLQQATQNGFRNYVWVVLHPDFMTVHGDPRFRELIRRGLHMQSI